MANNQLAKYKSFLEKKFLVIDDHAEFRTAIKRMVEAFGAVDIDTSSNGEDAVSMIKEKYYDAILCDYNLGEGKDGQQVLEEGKYSGAINESQIFILLTAENTADMVMGALEYEPDTYLIKPFTKEMVYERLTKAIEHKQELIEIYRAIEGSDPQTALAICDKKIAAGGKLVLSCLKIKGKQLIFLKRYEEAMSLYSSLLEARNLMWAFLGFGECFFYKEMYEEAIVQFEKILKENPNCVEALDWIAKANFARGKKIEAQKILEQSVALSSKAILRQQFLGDVALENEDFDVAEKAFKSAVSLGKYSCYRRDKDFFTYAHLMIKKMLIEDNAKNAAHQEGEAYACLQLVMNYNAANRLSQLPPYVNLLELQLLAGKIDKAVITVNKINGFFNINDSNKEYLARYAQALLKLPQQEFQKQSLDITAELERRAFNESE
jgi:CheY-like chemotaxis protein